MREFGSGTERPWWMRFPRGLQVHFVVGERHFDSELVYLRLLYVWLRMRRRVLDWWAARRNGA